MIAIDVRRKDNQRWRWVLLHLAHEGHTECEQTDRERQQSWPTSILLPISLAHYSGGAPGKKKKNYLVFSLSPDYPF